MRQVVRLECITTLLVGAAAAGPLGLTHNITCDSTGVSAQEPCAIWAQDYELAGQGYLEMVYRLAATPAGPLFMAGRELSAINVDDGSMDWFAAAAGSARFGDVVYYPETETAISIAWAYGTQTMVTAFNADNGSEVWRTPVDAWGDFNLGPRLLLSPDHSILLAASAVGSSIVALDPTNGSQLWSQIAPPGSVGGWNAISFSSDSSKLFATGWSGQEKPAPVIKVDSQTGNLEWMTLHQFDVTTVGTGIHSLPGGDVALVAGVQGSSTRAEVARLSAENGTVLWQFSYAVGQTSTWPTTSAASADGERIYVTTGRLPGLGGHGNFHFEIVALESQYGFLQWERVFQPWLLGRAYIEGVELPYGTGQPLVSSWPWSSRLSDETGILTIGYDVRPGPINGPASACGALAMNASNGEIQWASQRTYPGWRLMSWVETTGNGVALACPISQNGLNVTHTAVTLLNAETGNRLYDPW